jgi:hypothetical protein
MKYPKKGSNHQTTLCSESVFRVVYKEQKRAVWNGWGLERGVAFQVSLPAVAWVLSCVATPSRHLTDQSEKPYVEIKETPILAW